MTNHIFRRHYLAAASLLFAALIGLGAIHSHAILNTKVNNPNGPGLSKDTIGQNRIAIDTGVEIKNFQAAAVDSSNTKWFVTELGIVSYNGTKWTLHNKNRKVATQDLKGFAYEINPNGHELWIASPKGATVASLPIDGRSGATTYHTENTTIRSNNVLQVAIGKSPMRWFGTDNGVSAFRNDKWLTPAYDELYPADMFREFRITSMATSRDGDSLYVGTEGAGIARVFRNDVDAISGASVYAQWGPIILPSDKIYSTFIAADGTQWFGTDKGIARHTGNLTLTSWKVFTVKDGLADNFVQAITADQTGKIWIGTKKGISVFDGASWTSFTMDESKNSNNIRCIAVDKTGVIWFGTDNGVISYENGDFTGYR
jgi:ligand-binding sensor domain-containing protein